MMNMESDGGECSDGAYSYAGLYEAYDQLLEEKLRLQAEMRMSRNALQRFLRSRSGARARDGFARMQQCRDALDAMDRQGWQRSFHQRMFHENFIRACARVFFKFEPQGAFARAHQAILDLNGWDNLSQEILISTPRRSVLSRPQPIPPCVERVAARGRPVDGGLLVAVYANAEVSPPEHVPGDQRDVLVVGWLAVQGFVCPRGAVAAGEQLEVAVPEGLGDGRGWPHGRAAGFGLVVSRGLSLLAGPVREGRPGRDLAPVGLEDGRGRPCFVDP